VQTSDVIASGLIASGVESMPAPGSDAPASPAPQLDTRYDVARTLAGPAMHTRVIEADMERRWLQLTGELEEIARYAMLPSGKLFRPVLLIESALAVGGELAAVLPAAVGTECGHVASLIHDDIIDQDDMRRGRASVPAKFGEANAIIAGDLLIFRLFECLAECRAAGVSAERVAAALSATAAAGIDLCLGQSKESELTGHLECREADYIEMVRLKTGALFRGSCEVGGLLGGGTPEQSTALARYGNHLGIAFQICDDLLAYLSDPATMGKAAASDLRNRRLTLPLIMLLRSADPTDRKLIERIFTGNLDEDRDIERVATALHRSGALPATQDVARHHRQLAVDALETLPTTNSKNALRNFADIAIERAC
jgi:geranylgeranyl pyrophosphate synthase